DLVRATGREGLPWSCPDASVALELSTSGAATLILEDASGRKVTRRVPTPEDLVATGEALLAAPATTNAAAGSDAAMGAGSAATAPSAAPPPARNAPTAIAANPAPAADAVAAPMRDAAPRFLVQGAVGPRYAGATQAIWIGGQLRAAVP